MFFIDFSAGDRTANDHVPRLPHQGTQGLAKGKEGRNAQEGSPLEGRRGGH